MNRLIVLLLACLAFLGWGVSTVHAQAEIVKDGCGLLSVNSDGFLTSPVVFVQGKALRAPNPGGNILIKCRGQMPHRVSKQVTLDYSSTETVFGTGLYCGTPWGPTENWKQVVTPSGQAILTCHINPSSTP